MVAIFLVFILSFLFYLWTSMLPIEDEFGERRDPRYISSAFLAIVTTVLFVFLTSMHQKQDLKGSEDDKDKLERILKTRKNGCIAYGN